MALWKLRRQPFKTYRDPETGQWIVVKPSQPLQDIVVEAPVYRDPETGQWITVQSSSPLDF